MLALQKVHKSSQLDYWKSLSHPVHKEQVSVVVEVYHYTLDGFVGYPITSHGITSYLSRLTCGNGKAKFYSCLRALCNWLYRSGYIRKNPIILVSPPKIQKRLLPAVNQVQLEKLLNYSHCERDKAIM